MFSKLKFIILIPFLLLFLYTSSYAITYAEQVDFLIGGIHSADGQPLASGRVYTYMAGTSTTKALYVDRAMSSAAANPLILDSRGAAKVFGAGLYRFVIKASDGTTVATYDNIALGIAEGNFIDAAEYTENDYPSLNKAVTAAGSVQTTIIIRETTKVTANLTIPANVSLYVTKSGRINQQAYTLNFANKDGLESGIHAVFTGTGVAYGLGVVYPDYWGDNTTPGTTDMSAEINYAFDSAQRTSGVVKFLPVTYYTGTTQVVLGPTDSGEKRVRAEMPAGSLIRCNIASDYCVKLQNLGYSELEFKVWQNNVTGHGIFIGNNGNYNSISNTLHVWVGRTDVPATNKPALGAGTFGVTFGAPPSGYSNYYNQISGWVQNFDTSIYLPHYANANRVNNFTAYMYWYGIQVASAQNHIQNIFGTNAKGNIGGVSFDFADGDVNTTTNVINKTAHGLIDGDEIKLSTTGGVPNPLYVNTRYFVQRVDADNFKLASYKSTSASYTINIHTLNSGTHTLQQQFYSDLIHLGNGTLACTMNNIFVASEPGGESTPSGTHSRTIFGEMLAEGNIIFSSNNTLVNTYDNHNLSTHNTLIESIPGGTSTANFYDVTVNNGFRVNGPIYQSGPSEYPNGGFLLRATKRELHTLTLGAASDTTTLLIPAGALILGASFNVDVAVTDSTGNDTWSAAFITGATNTLATAAAPALNTKVNRMVTPTVTSATTEIRFTPNGGNFTAGVIDIVVYYMSLSDILSVGLPQ